MGHDRKLDGPDLALGIAASDLVENVPLLGHAAGDAVILIRTRSGIRAVGATCTHYSGPLAEGLIVGETVRCPWHHACFDLRSGEALGAPALDPIACYEVSQRADRVMARVQDMRGGKDYDADFATRMKGSGLWAELIRQRFEKATQRIGFNRERFEFDMSQFRPPSLDGQTSLF